MTAQLQERGAQPYAAIRARTTMEGFAKAVHESWPALFGRLGDLGVAPTGPPFIRYLVIDPAAELEVEFSLPVADRAADDGRMRFDVLPAGRYATLMHTGSYGGLQASHDALQQWAREQDIALDSRDTGHGVAWGALVEHYLVDAASEPDSSKWQVEIAGLTAGRADQ